MHDIHAETPESIIFAGDWHGNFHQAKTVVNLAIDSGSKHIIHAGDFGIWRSDDSYLYALNEALRKHGIMLYFVDGNHEDFPRLYTYPVQETGTREIRSNIHHLPRGFRWEWDTIRFLAMGGAYSVDKDMRTTGHDHWDEELITQEDIDKAGTEPTDVLICHDSPQDAPNPITDNPESQARGVRWFGKNNISAAHDHRVVLKQVTDNTDPVLIVHGHYHAPLVQPFIRKSTGRRCFVHSLDQGGGRWIDLKNHAAIYTLELLKEIKGEV